MKYKKRDIFSTEPDVRTTLENAGHVPPKAGRLASLIFTVAASELREAMKYFGIILAMVATSDLRWYIYLVFV